MAKTAKTEIRRAWAFEEIRAERVGDEMRVKGVVAPFNRKTNVAGMWTEVIKPGAFTKTLQERDQVALLHHDVSKVVGRKSAGTLDLQETKRGLEFDLLLPNSTIGADAFESIRRKDFGGMSFRFMATKETWTEQKGKTPDVLRELHEVSMPEVSLVTDPQYSHTSVAEARAFVEELRARHILDDSEDATQEPDGDLRNEPGQPPTPGEADRTTQEPDLEERKREIAEKQIRLNQKRKEHTKCLT